MISVCMIVKNEEALLANCLQSVSDADEIVVCDTGSEDSTIDIAKHYGATICHYDWDDNFANARNHALSFVSGDYVLSIDADETLEKDGITKLREFSTEDAYLLTLKPNNGSWIGQAPRYMKSTNYFIGPIHEYPAIKGTVRTGVTVNIGYSPTHSIDPERNLRILEKAVKEEPKNPRWWYYLGREYFSLRPHEDIIRAFNECTKYSTWTGQKADALLYMARSYWNNRKGTLARRACLNALGLNPNFREAALFMAEMSWDHNKAPWLAMAEAADNTDVAFLRIV